MVCAKCQKLVKTTTLATPGVKKRADSYYAASSSSNTTKSTGGGAKAGATLGTNGVSKSKLLSKSAKNPYAAYASNCDGCHTKTEAGRKYCQRCAYQKNACPMCGKSMAAKSSGGSKPPVVDGQKRTLK
ncbi:hypothetical protein AAFC00_004036 [Neodothiora populina]|uniref:Cysteine-rich PDZ-binding protein n=1 Tax=Neodothiora populina TaxID=2781224 RepID=A0ABR3PJF0_9PEZI